MFLLFLCGAASAASAPHEDGKGTFAESHSMHPPFVNLEEIPNFEMQGDALVTEEYVRLTNQGSQGAHGALVNTEPLAEQAWEIELTFKVQGDRRLGGEGLALWFTEEGFAEGNAMGAAERFTGLGVFFDSYDNDQAHDNPSIYAVVNDGSSKFVHEKDGAGQILDNGGAQCKFDFRNTEQPVKAVVSYIEKTLTVLVDSSGNENYHACFSSFDVSLPSSGHVFLSAQTGQVSDSQDVFQLSTYILSQHDTAEKEGFSNEDEGHPDAAVPNLSPSSSSPSSSSSWIPSFLQGVIGGDHGHDERHHADVGADDSIKAIRAVFEKWRSDPDYYSTLMQHRLQELTAESEESQKIDDAELKDREGHEEEAENYEKGLDDGFGDDGPESANSVSGDDSALQNLENAENELRESEERLQSIEEKEFEEINRLTGVVADLEVAAVEVVTQMDLVKSRLSDHKKSTQVMFDRSRGVTSSKAQSSVSALDENEVAMALMDASHDLGKTVNGVFKDEFAGDVFKKTLGDAVRSSLERAAQSSAAASGKKEAAPLTEQQAKEHLDSAVKAAKEAMTKSFQGIVDKHNEEIRKRSNPSEKEVAGILDKEDNGRYSHLVEKLGALQVLMHSTEEMIATTANGHRKLGSDIEGQIKDFHQRVAAGGGSSFSALWTWLLLVQVILGFAIVLFRARREKRQSRVFY